MYRLLKSGNESDGPSSLPATVFYCLTIAQQSRESESQTERVSRQQ